MNKGKYTMQQNKQEQELQQQIIELVLNLTDGYCDLSKYSFNDEAFARFEFYIQELLSQSRQEAVEKLKMPIKKNSAGYGAVELSENAKKELSFNSGWNKCAREINKKIKALSLVQKMKQ